MVLVWVIGGTLLLTAGFAAALLPRLRERRRARRIAWSTARTAIEGAAVSRDAAPHRVPEAEQLLARAEFLAARNGGAAAARSVTGYAHRADELWRTAADA